MLKRYKEQQKQSASKKDVPQSLKPKTPMKSARQEQPAGIEVSQIKKPEETIKAVDEDSWKRNSIF